MDSSSGFIKIAISGFSQDVFTIQHRGCDIEKIKENMKNLARMRDEGGHKILVMLDYIYYEYNAHEYSEALELGRELDFIVSRRPGNLHKLAEEHAELAKETKHTTFNQAIELGKKAEAKQIYLTHFSPRIEDKEIEELEYKYNFISLHPCQKINVDGI